MMTDAMGNEVVIGKKYGSYHKSSGMLTVIIGVVDKFFENGKVRMKDMHKAGALSSGELNYESIGVKCKPMNANGLFPVYDEINWPGKDTTKIVDNNLTKKDGACHCRREIKDVNNVTGKLYLSCTKCRENAKRRRG